MRRSQTRPEFADLNQLEFSLLENSTVAAAIIAAPDGTVLGANRKMRAVLGVPNLQELRARNICEFIDESEWQRWLDAWRSGGGPLRTRLGGRGAAVDLDGDISCLGSAEDGAVCGLFAERGGEQQLRKAVQQSARMEALSSLTAGIAHDFNNLLTVLVGNLYLVAEELRDKPQTFAKLKAARDAGKRGADLIRQLLAFARREQVEAAVVDPRKVVTDLVPLLRRALGSKVGLETDLGAGSGVIRSSIAQLESVVVNLAINARDAIAGKGKVAVRVREQVVSRTEAVSLRLPAAGDYLALSVADNGQGIRPEVIDRVFEPFFSTKGETGGTGLGLCMVRWFAEQAGGTVDLSSQVGKGTTVTLLLPKSAETPVDSNDGTMPLSTLPTGTEHVLVLATDAAVRTTIKQVLQVLGYTVEFAANLEALGNEVMTGKFRVLIVDEGAADHEALARVRDAGAGIAIIVAAGSAARGNVLGATTLLKPFSIADLAGTVRCVIDGRSTRP